MPPKALPSKAESVKVVVRCRPMNEKEKAARNERVVEMDPKRGLIEVRPPHQAGGEDKKSFTFDAVYDWNSKQRDLYDETFRDLVQAVLDGFNGTIFAYGQTGTGKTFTMQGVKNDEELKGVIPHSFDHIFSHIARTENQQYLVRASYLEIYMEEIRDLLAKDQEKRLELKERPDTGVYVKDLSSFVTKSMKEIEHVMNVGNSNRSVGATNMNEQSSRSHAIFIITIECSQVILHNLARVPGLPVGVNRRRLVAKQLRFKFPKIALGADGENHIRVGKLNLVDLAGSERQAKTQAAGERLKEATKINLSLSALGNVISALVDGKSSHIPYRDSKLTRLLQDSLGGNAKTVMVANIGPADYNFDETVTTLRYANRAKNIKNKPKVNEDPKDALLREFQEEIARLKAALSGKGGSGARKSRTKRPPRTGPNGEIISDGEDEEDSQVEDEDDYMKKQMAKLDSDKQAILNNKTIIAEEKEKILHELSEREERLAKEKEAKDKLQKQIQAMESKLLCGGKNIVDHTNEQQRALDERRKEIAEQQRKEREIKQKLEEQEESALNMTETYNSLQQEVDSKTKKLKKLYSKLQATKQEIVDLQEANARERQELEQTQNELTRELKLKILIIENFIPPDEKTKVLSRSEFDEEEDSWKLKPLSKGGSETMMKRPASAAGRRRPVCEYARKAAVMSGDFRYKGENILQIDLDMPNRTTRDYEGPSVAPRIQAVLDQALEDEGDIDIDDSLFSSKAKEKAKKKDRGGNVSRTKSARHQQAADPTMFPTSRGLVPK